MIIYCMSKFCHFPHNSKYLERDKRECSDVNLNGSITPLLFLDTGEFNITYMLGIVILKSFMCASTQMIC